MGWPKEAAEDLAAVFQKFYWGVGKLPPWNLWDRFVSFSFADEEKKKSSSEQEEQEEEKEEQDDDIQQTVTENELVAAENALLFRKAEETPPQSPNPQGAAEAHLGTPPKDFGRPRGQPTEEACGTGSGGGPGKFCPPPPPQ